MVFGGRSVANCGSNPVEATFMRQNSFGKLPSVSALTLGGGGIGMVWGETTFGECVATLNAAVAAGINLIDLAPRYGDGKAEQVVGEAFGGRLADGVRVTSKCNLGNASSEEIEPLLRQSIEGSLERLRLPRLDLFFSTRSASLAESPIRIYLWKIPLKSHCSLDSPRCDLQVCEKTDALLRSWRFQPPQSGGRRKLVGYRHFVAWI